MKLGVLFGEGNLKLREKKGGYALYIFLLVGVCKVKLYNMSCDDDDDDDDGIGWVHGWMVFVVVRSISHLPSFPSYSHFYFFFFFYTSHFPTCSFLSGHFLQK